MSVNSPIHGFSKLGLAIMDALGFKGQNVRSVTLRVHCDEVITATAEVLTTEGQIEQVVKCFEEVRPVDVARLPLR